MARILKATPNSIRKIAVHLASGGIAAVPTETVYGLAADALNPRACAAIFRAKNRPRNDPLIVHVTGLREATKLASFNPVALTLARRFWPGPLTIILPRKKIVPDIVTSRQQTVGLRAPSHRVMRALLRACGKPLAAPSANPFMRLSPTTAEHVNSGLGDRIDWILDGGPCTAGVESTIIDLTNPSAPRILRHGAIPEEEIEAALKTPLRKNSAKKKNAPLAPGMFVKHYSPRARLVLAKEISEKQIRPLAPDEAAIVFRGTSRPAARVYALTRNGSLRAAAKNLFSLLHKIDATGAKIIHCQRAPDIGLGRAINDRLRRAAAK